MLLNITHVKLGQVIGEAQGSESSIEKFVQHIHMGPSAAKVSKVETEDMTKVDGEAIFKQ
jgi:acylphosphatase